MPIPEKLIEIIQTIGNHFKPDDERQEYRENRHQWELYLALFENDTKRIAHLLEQHPGESEERFKHRKKLSAIFNYVPMVTNMIVNYLFAEQPVLDADDPALKAFLADCDGAGTSFSHYVKQVVLPLALTMGFIDVLIQHPSTPDGMFVTGADELTAPEGSGAVCYSITPLQRIDWSANPSGEYNWVRFVDMDAENPNPFYPSRFIETISGGMSTVEDRRFFDPRVTFVTISGHVHFWDADGTEYSITDEQGRKVGFWLRSWRPLNRMQTAMNPAMASPAGTNIEGITARDWLHDGDWLPMPNPPIATMYYRKSVDYKKRHFGLSKITMIALLTVKIIQLLSWTDEDILSNLALFVFPGDQPKDDTGKPIDVKLTPWKAIFVGNNAGFHPTILQGATSHIEIKMKLTDAYIREILRLAYMIGVSAEAEQINSGVQGVVARNELFMELSDLAGSLDAFTLDVLWIVVQWQGKGELTRREFLDQYKPTVSFYKGPYAVDPLSVVIANSASLIETFDRVSPEMVRAVYRELAQSALYNEDESRDVVFDEIDEYFNAQQAAREQANAEISASLSTSDPVNPGGAGANGQSAQSVPQTPVGQVATPSVANGGADAGNAGGIPGEGGGVSYVAPGKLPRTANPAP